MLTKIFDEVGLAAESAHQVVGRYHALLRALKDIAVLVLVYHLI